MEWQPIETAPKDGTYVWLWNGYRRIIARYEKFSDLSEGWLRQNIIGEPTRLSHNMEHDTHWMPLPDPPKDDQP